MTDARTDRGLVAACREGDAGAFEALYRRHRDALHRMAFRLSRDDEAALDAVQEAFFYLLRKLNEPGFELGEGVRLTTLLYPVLRSRVVDAARVKTRYAGDAEDVLHRVAAADAGPTASERSEVRRVLDALPEAQREAIELHVLEGLTLAEVATATGAPLGTAKTRVHHALRKLREDPATRRHFGKS